MTWQGNKGAVGVRMKVFDSTMCFVCGHLAAHHANVAGRNDDFATITAKLEFKPDESSETCVHELSLPLCAVCAGRPTLVAHIPLRALPRQV